MATLLGKDNMATQTQQNPANQILNALLSLSQNANPVGNATTMAAQQGMNMGQQSGDALAPIMGDVSKKVLTKYLTGHAENLLATNPDAGAQILAAHIPGNTGGASGSWGPSSTGTSTQLAPNQLGNSPTNVSNQATLAQPPAQTQTQQTPQAQGGVNALGIIGNLLHNFSQGAGQAMMNSAGVGQFQGQQAQAGLMRQQMQNMNPNGGIQAVGQAQSQVPLTQEQKANVQAGVNTASIQSMNDQMARLQAQRDQLTKEFTAEIGTLPPLRNPLSQKMTPRMVQIRKQLADLNTTQNDLHNQFMTWKPTNVNQSSQSQDDNKGNSFTVGRFQVSKG